MPFIPQLIHALFSLEYKARKQNIGAPLRKENSKKTQGIRNKGKNENKDQEDNISLFGRDTSLFLFKALGKILYCKSESFCYHYCLQL